MKSILASIVLSVAVSIAVGSLCNALFSAEWKAEKIEGENGGVFMVPELGAVVLPKGDDLVVEMAGSPQTRPKAYRDVDLKQGDIIMMFNGSRVKSISDLERDYAILKVNDLVKLGISRDGSLMIVSFPKADSADMPQRHMVVMAPGDSGSVSVQELSGGKLESVDINDAAILGGAGLILAAEGEHLVVKKVLPSSPKIEGLGDVKEGDVLLKVDGLNFDKVGDLSDYWEGIKVGQTVTLTLQRDGKEQVVKFKKPEVKNEPVIIRKKTTNN